MNEVLASKGLTKVTDGAVLLTGIKGPLEEGWQKKVQAFADQITSLPTNLVIENRNDRDSNSPLRGRPQNTSGVAALYLAI